MHSFPRCFSFFLGFVLTVCSGLAAANPEGGVVVVGEGRIVESGSRMDVIQGTDRLGINWDSFSIGRGEHVNFDQPSSSAVALNRVTGGGVSNIEGMLTANGNVFLVNENGVFFHRGSVVDVGGLLATTGSISNQDFLAGRYRFEGGNPDARVVNEGSITAAEGGLVALVAPSVRNAGVIRARLGKVVLGGGESYTLDLYGDELITFAIDSKAAEGLKGVDGEPLVDHSGTIVAPGGSVYLTAGAASGVVDSVINVSGVIQAQAVSDREGRIVLHGGAGGVTVAGTLDATGSVGGEIDVLGGGIELASTASIDVSGARGGGTIHIGGDYQGKGVRQRAGTTTIASGAVIRADATDLGDGGVIIIWSDDYTEVDGNLSARGGPSGGDGGLIETSSAGVLEFSQSVRVSAPKGKAGTWLLDPEDIEIDRGKADSIEETLNDGGSVRIETSSEGDGDGDIEVNASITKTEGGDAKLSLKAHGEIEVNKPIKSTEGKLSVSLKAGKKVKVRADVDTNGGRFSTKVTGDMGEPKAEEREESREEESRSEPEESEPVTSEIEIVEEVERPEEVLPEAGEGLEDPVSGIEVPRELALPEGVEQPVEVEVSVPQEVAMPESGGQLVEVQVPVEVAAPETGGDWVAGIEVPREVAAPESGGGWTGGIEAPEEVGVPEVVDVPRNAGTSLDTLIDASPEPLVSVTDSVISTGGGEISVDAGTAGGVVITGSLDASNHEAGQTGGDIEVLGQHIVIAGDARIDSSGDSGGGDIHIGGDYQGKGERPNAETTTIGERVVINADATREGDAGQVVIWSDGTTEFQGTISARGGPEGGDGGLVEVSGKQNLGFHGDVDAGAPNGTPGTLLLDPETLTIIDAPAGDGDQDLNLFCDGTTADCWIPALRFLATDPGDLFLGFLTPADFADLGIDPNPNTPLNTISWGRLIQLAEVTGFGIQLEAEYDINFAELDGTVSTPGAPTGSGDGYTITLDTGFPSLGVGPDINVLTVTSHHGDILFDDPTDNLAIVGGTLDFIAPEGNLQLGNLYALGPSEIVPLDAQTSWRRGSIELRAGGSIQTGSLNTRVDPSRMTDPTTGAPLPQSLLVSDPTSFDPASIDPQIYYSDLARGGEIAIRAGGTLDITGPVYTGTGTFIAEAGGDFTATHIDTGANRLLVKSSPGDPGTINTLNTGDVDISANTIAFDRINAGSVRLATPDYAPDAIVGDLVFDYFRNSDFIDGRPESEGFTGRPATELGLNVTAGALLFDLQYDLAEIGATSMGSSGSVFGLSGLEYTGGDRASETMHTPTALAVGNVVFVAPPGVIPISVPLPPTSEPGQSAAPIAVALDGPQGISLDLQVISADTGSSTPAPGIDSIIPPTLVDVPDLSSADVQRIKDEGREEQAEDTPECADADRLEWVARGPRSAARDADFGRRSSVGTDPEDTRYLFKPGSCYFTDASG